MVFTSYLSKYKGTKGVSVANKTPEWADCERCDELMPPWELVKDYKSGKISWKEFRRAYIKQLKKLDVREFYHRLSGRVLLCWEKSGCKCHRNIIREWFNRNGYSCEELEADLEQHTCGYCKQLDNHHSSNLHCTITGEVYTNAQQQARTCEEWRSRCVRNDRH